MGRQPCCDKVGLKKGPWTVEEDKKLITFILNNGQCCWRIVPKLAGLRRCGKSCRLRWTNYLRPDLKRGLLSEAEEKIVIDIHARIGNKWSKIASRLPGRTDNDIKNHWNTHIKKKLVKMGIDPVTHQPLGNQANKTQDTAIVVAEAKVEESGGHVVHHQETRAMDSNRGRESCDSKVEEGIASWLLLEDTPLLDEQLYSRNVDNSINFDASYNWLLDHPDSWNINNSTNFDATYNWLLDYPEIEFMGLIENGQHTYM